jgi:hypothetical protein
MIVIDIRPLPNNVLIFFASLLNNDSFQYAATCCEIQTRSDLRMLFLSSQKMVAERLYLFMVGDVNPRFKISRTVF